MSEPRSLSQRECASLLRATFRAETTEDSVFALGRYLEQLTPRCQLAGALQVGANMLHLTQARVVQVLFEGSIDARALHLLGRFLSRRKGFPNQPGISAIEVRSSDVFDAVADALRTEPKDGAFVPHLIEDEKALTVAGLVEAVAYMDSEAVRVLLADYDPEDLVHEALVGIGRLCGAAEVLTGASRITLNELASQDPFPVLDILATD